MDVKFLEGVTLSLHLCDCVKDMWPFCT